MYQHRIFLVAFLVLIAGCRQRRGTRSWSGEGIESSLSEVKGQASFALSPDGLSSPGTCSKSGAARLRPSDTFGNWSPSNGDYTLSVEVHPLITYYYHVTNPAYGSGYLGDQLMLPYVWQSNYDVEIAKNSDGTYDIISPSRQSLKFLSVGGVLKAQDGSRDYLVQNDPSTIVVYHRDEVGSYDTYKLVNYRVQAFQGKSNSRSPGTDACVMSPAPANPPKTCRNYSFPRFLYQSTTYATDQSKSISLTRNAFGYVETIQNVNNKTILKITYNSNGGMAILPTIIQDASEIPSNYQNTRLAWNFANIAPLLTQVTYKNEIGDDSHLNFSYDSYLGLTSMSSDEPGNVSTTKFTPTNMNSTDATFMSIAQVKTGTFTTKFLYNKYIKNGSIQAYTVDIQRFVIDSPTPNTTERLVLDPTTCKIVEYIDPTGKGVLYTRNDQDPELVDIVSNEFDKIEDQSRVVRRGAGDPIQALDIVAIQSAMKGSQKFHTDESYVVDAASGLTTEIRPLDDPAFATVIEYDDMSEFPKFGSRVTNISQKQGGQVWGWSGFVYDKQAPFRLRAINQDGITKVTYDYGKPSSQNIPLQLTTTYPTSPLASPQVTEADEFGDWTSYDTIGGIKVTRDINAQLRRVEKVTGVSVLKPTYNGANPWTIDRLEQGNEDLVIERPDALTTTLKYRGMKTDSTAKPAARTSVVKPNGLMDSSSVEGLPLISNFFYQSQP